MIAVIICLMILVLILGCLYMAYAFYVSDDKHLDNVQAERPAFIQDDLSRAILTLIDDTYSPFYAVRLTDHLSSDLDIDSLDIVDILFDVSQIAGVELSASELYRQYGRNPTVAQLIAYTRYVMNCETS